MNDNINYSYSRDPNAHSHNNRALDDIKNTSLLKSRD